ncbi:MAG: hypothetical protein RMJ81_00385 [Candidatus Kryptonium sp.]|nr:hypothetical protein [Candidatus Kryptonium sp.]
MHYKFLAFLLIFSFVIVVFNSCVDTSVQNITTIDYKSQVQFVNLAIGVGGISIKVDGESFGTVAFSEQMPSYREVPSGAKKVVVDYENPRIPNDTFSIVFDTERKMRVFIIGDTTTRTFVKADERYIWQTKDSKEGSHLFPADTFQVRVFHGVRGGRSVDSVRVRVGTRDTTIAFPLAYSRVSSYIKFRVVGVPYTFIARSGRDSLTSVVINPEAKRRYTVILYDSPMKSKALIDD